MNLLLSLTEQCNLRCTYCYYNETHVGRNAVMSDEILFASIRLTLERAIKLKHHDVGITFFGGEPLLRMDAIKRGVEFSKQLAIEYADRLPKDFKFNFAVNTNGTLITDAILDFFEAEDFQIFLSLDGPAEKHNLARVRIDGSGSFDGIAPHLPRLTKMNVLVLSVVTQKHVKGLASSVQWLIDQGFRKMTTLTDYNGEWTSELYQDLAYEYQELAGIWLKQKLKDPTFYIGTIQDKISLDVLQLRQRNQMCYIYKGAIGVATNGNVFPCSRFINSKPNAKYMLGNVLTDKEKVFNNAVSRDVSKFLKSDKPQCEGCAIRYRCDAHECGCTSFYTTGDIRGVSAEVCTHERILVDICNDAIIKYQSLGGLY